MDGYNALAGLNNGSDSHESEQNLPSIGAERPTASTEAQLAHGEPSEIGYHLESVPTVHPSCADSDISFDPASFSSVGDSSNTPSLKTTVGGEDWLSLSLYVDHGEFDCLCKVLSAAKQRAELGDKGGDEVVYGDTTFMVKPHGARRGSVAKGCWMEWVLQSEEGSKLQIARRDKAHKTQANMAFVVSSDTLVRFGIRAVYAKLLYWLDGMGATLVQNKVSRVDACVDLPGVPVSTFSRAFHAGRYVARARKKSDYFGGLDGGTHYEGEESTGFVIGKAPLMLRVYDKLKRSQGDPVKMWLMTSMRWGGVPECATRVEFEITRPYLKKMGVDSLEDWLEKRAAICQKLCTSWFRMTSEPVDRKHANRAAMLPAWGEVTNAFAEWCGPAGDVKLIPIPSSGMDISRYWKAAVGYAIGALARAGKKIPNEDMFLREVRAGVLDALMGRDIAEEIRRKSLELGI